MIPEAEVSNERRKRILVVEDEDEIRILVARVLRSVGHEVSAAGGGEEALALIGEAPPDLVVLDLMMDGVDGWQVLQGIRKFKRRPAVIVLTGLGRYEDFARAVREGAQAYVVKPFRFHELLATCEKVLLSEETGRRRHMTERRSEPRRLLIVEVSVLSRDRAPIAVGELLDLSLAGARVELGVALEIDDTVWLAFHLPSGTPLRLGCRVRWRHQTAVGFVHGLAFFDLGVDDRRLLTSLLQPPA